MKIQALAVAAATLAFAAPALPAHARGQNMIRPDINHAARAHCNALRRGANWSQAMGVGLQTPFGQYWYANASDKNKDWLAGEYANALRVLCPTMEQRAFRAHQRNQNGGGSRYTGGYTGGNTTIQEDPFEF